MCTRKEEDDEKIQGETIVGGTEELASGNSERMHVLVEPSATG